MIQASMHAAGLMSALTKTTAQQSKMAALNFDDVSVKPIRGW